MKEVAELMGADKERANKDMTKAWAFMGELLELSVPSLGKGKNISWAEASELFPKVPWGKILTKEKLNELKSQNIYMDNYLEELPSLLEKTQKRTIANYLGWMYVYNRLDGMGSDLLEAHQKSHLYIYQDKYP